MQTLVTDPRINDLIAKLEYLHYEVSKLKSQTRYLAAEQIRNWPLYTQTMASFDFQWQGEVSVGWTSADLDSICDTVLAYTKLDRDWFIGKRVLDAGCGSGRFSCALSKLGAKVVAIDQSSAAVNSASQNCGALAESIEFKVKNLLDDTQMEENFDLVWSYGVLHHTGNTFYSLKNISKLVKNGGYIFVMLYGEPVFDDAGAFFYYAEVEKLRRETFSMNFTQRHEYLRKIKGDEAGGWFDAVSPIINDTYSFHEIESWFSALGFSEVLRTVIHPSHHIRARRPN